MTLFDVNVLIYAHREETPDHKKYKDIVEKIVNNNETYGISSLVASGFLRVATHPRIFTPPTPQKKAFTFINEIMERPNCVLIEPGALHWSIFCSLCEKSNARGNLVPDAYIAAMAIESGNVLITTDRDYSRFPGLKWKHPLENS